MNIEQLISQISGIHYKNRKKNLISTRILLKGSKTPFKEVYTP